MLGSGASGREARSPAPVHFGADAVKVGGRRYRTIWTAPDGWSVEVIDQTRLPHEFVVRRLTSLEEAADAIRTMVVRGAPLIGATAAYGLCLQAREDPSDRSLASGREELLAARPTAINLRWAVDKLLDVARRVGLGERVRSLYAAAVEICDADVRTCEAIGRHGVELIRAAQENKRAQEPVQILRTATRDGSPPSTGALLLHPSTPHMMRESICTSGSTRLGPGTRVPV